MAIIALKQTPVSLRMRNKLRRLVKKLIAPKDSYLYFGTNVFHSPRSFLIEQLYKEERQVYEYENVKLIKQLIKPGTWYVDVGANIGLMSVPFLRLTNAKVVSIEASPSNFAFLKKSHSASAYQSRWTIIGQAVSQNEGKTTFFSAGEDMAAFDSIFNTQRVTVDSQMEVDVTTLDRIWEKLNCPEISCIKIDVEGADYLVLLGSEKLIQKFNPSILIEWNLKNLAAANVNLDVLLNWCDQNKYQMFTTDLLPVVNVQQLRFLMAGTEYFLLLPKVGI